MRFSHYPHFPRRNRRFDPCTVKDTPSTSQVTRNFVIRQLGGIRLAHRLRGAQSTLGGSPSETVDGTANAAPASIQDVRVNRRRTHVGVAEELLNGRNVVPVFEQIGRKGSRNACGPTHFAMPACRASELPFSEYASTFQVGALSAWRAGGRLDVMSARSWRPSCGSARSREHILL